MTSAATTSDLLHGSSPFALTPLVLVEEHGAELGELGGRIVELGQDDHAFVDRERE